MAGIIACFVALALFFHALTLAIREHARKRRMLPVEARLIDPGRTGVVSVSDQAWASNQAQDRDRSIREGSEPDTHLPTPASPTYTARWSYSVDGKAHRGEHSQSSPVFLPEQIRFGRVQVFYDRDEPSVSRPFPGAGDSAWAFFVAAGVAGVVAFLLTVIPAGNP
jgi:hypothetical protein